MTQVRVLCGDKSVVASIKSEDIEGDFSENDKLCVTAYHVKSSSLLKRVEVTRKRPDGTKETSYEMRPDKNRILSILDRSE